MNPTCMKELHTLGSESLAVMRVEATWVSAWERSQGSSEMRRISSVCESKAWYVNVLDSICDSSC